MPDERQGAVRIQPGQGQEAAGRSRLPRTASAFKVQVCACNPDHMDLLPLIAALPRESRREARDPAHGVRRVPLGDDHAQDEYARLLHEQRPHQSDDNHPQELHHGTGQWNPVAARPIRRTTKKMDVVYLERDESKRQAMLKEMTREILDNAPYIWLPTPYMYHRLVAVGEELQRRDARRRGASRPDLCAHLDRPGVEEEAGLLRSPGSAPAVPPRRCRPRTPWLSPSCKSAI